MSEEKTMMDITAKMNGIIMKKAELENDYTGTYAMIFERMQEVDMSEDSDFISVLGHVAG